jgi:hypothetical protein
MNLEDIDKTIADLDRKINELTNKNDDCNFLNWFKKPKEEIKLIVKKTGCRVLKEALQRININYDMYPSRFIGSPTIFKDKKDIGYMIHGNGSYDIVTTSNELVECVRYIVEKDLIFKKEFSKNNIEITLE